MNKPKQLGMSERSASQGGVSPTSASSLIGSGQPPELELPDRPMMRRTQAQGRSDTAAAPPSASSKPNLEVAL